jgi:chromosome segregation ATPase
MRLAHADTDQMNNLSYNNDDRLHINNHNNHNNNHSHNNNLNNSASSRMGLGARPGPAVSAAEHDELRSMYEELQAMSLERLRAAEADTLEVRRERDAVEAELNTALASADAAREQVKFLETFKRQAGDECESLRSRLRDAEASARDAGRQLEDFQASAQRLMGELHDARRRGAALEERLRSEGIDVVGDDGADIDDPEVVTRLSALRMRLGELEECVRERDAAVKMLEHQKRVAVERACDAEARGEDLSARLEDAAAHAAERRELYESLARERADDQRRILDLNARLRTLGADLERERARALEVEVREAGAGDELGALRARVRDLDTQAAAVPHLRDSIDDLTQRLSNRAKILLNTENALTECRDSCEGAVCPFFFLCATLVIFSLLFLHL